MTSLTKTKTIGTGLPCLFGGFPSYDKEQESPKGDF